MLVDSNIIIYAAKPEHEKLRRLIREHAPAVSAVSYIEVLGYHRLTRRVSAPEEEVRSARLSRLLTAAEGQTTIRRPSTPHP